MRVALFSSTLSPRDGYGNITVELTRHLHERGIDLTLFLPKSQQKVAENAPPPFPVRCVLPEYIYRLYQPRALRYWWQSCDLSGFDLAHSIFEFPYCIIAARSARRHRLPFIMGAQGTHGVRPLTYVPERFFVKRCYRQATRFVVPSVFTRDLILAYAKEAYAMEVIHNGVNAERFSRTLDLSNLQSQYKNRKILLTVGGLWGRKGHDLVIRALPQVIREHPDVLYLIVGDGNKREILESLCRELHVENHVAFLGAKSGDDLVAHFQIADIYVHTPTVVDLKFEGFGIVYLEASACGKPIVATDAGGVRDAVLDQQTGLIAPDEDVPGIAERINQLLRDPELRKRLGEAGRAYARENDWTHIAERYDRLYRTAVHG